MGTPRTYIRFFLNRIKKASVEVGKEIVEAIIDDAAKKFLDAEHTCKVVKTSLMSAEHYVAKNKDEALRAYLRIFRSLAEEFKERKFVDFSLS